MFVIKIQLNIHGNGDEMIQKIYIKKDEIGNILSCDRVTTDGVWIGN
jgi:hypothetical protein